MNRTIAILLSIFSISSYADCSMPKDGDKNYYRPNSIIKTKVELEKLANKEYQSKVRPIRRFYKNDKNEYEVKAGLNKIIVDQSFFDNLSNQIVFALDNGLVDSITYTDMGHGHAFIETSKWNNKEQNHKRIERYLNESNFKFLYHTAELFDFNQSDFPNQKLPSDPWLLKRYENRNLLSDNFNSNELRIVKAVGKSFNTVRSIKDHKKLTNIYFIPNKNGCFSYYYNGKATYYDVSLFL
jgi:hypothetical protein